MSQRAAVRPVRVARVRGRRRRADRPHRDGACDADEAAADRDGVRLHVLDRERADPHVALGPDVCSGREVGVDGDGGDADVDAARGSDEAARDTSREGERVEDVGRDDGDGLSVVDAGDDRSRALVDRRAEVDVCARDDGEDVDADVGGDADEAGADARDEPEELLGRLRLHDETAERRGREAAGPQRAVRDAREAAALRLDDHGVVLAEVREGGLLDHGDADAHTDADVPGGDRGGDEDELRGIARRTLRRCCRRGASLLRR